MATKRSWGINLGKPGLNLIGRRFDKLVVLNQIIKKSASGRIWLCQCDCGEKIIKITTQLRRLNQVYTGCRLCERISRSDSKIKHGGARLGKTRLFNIWKAIKSRCTNPNEIIWKYYGGKGVSRCSEWNDFSVFRKWSLENGYKDNLVIDRINSAGNYEPSNCQWITASENTRRAHLGKKKKLKGAA